MASYNEILMALASEEGVISTADLAPKVSSTKDTLRASCSQLKKKGYVDGNSKEGWIITSEGRELLERREKIPTTPEDVGADTESKLKYYGQLAGAKPDSILATCEMILTGDPEDLTYVWDAMTQMDVPMPARRKWFNLWRNHLKQGIPPHLKEKVAGFSEQAGEETGETPSGAKDRGRDYIIVDDLPVFVGAGQGDMSMKDAKDIIGMRAIKARFSARGGDGQAGGGAQQFTPKDLLDIIDKINAGRGGATPTKSYVVTQGEEGAVVQEVEEGKPMVLEQPRSAPPATYFVDNQGNVKQVQPGEPIVIKQQPANATPKTLIVRQTDKGIVTEEVEAGKPIILGSSSPSTGMPPALPFPVFGSDGKPVYDSDGKPVYANLEPTLKWLSFQGEQRRLDERHQMLGGVVKTVQENFGDGIQALKRAIAEATGTKTSTESSSPQVFKCGDCGTQFSPPAGWEGQPLRCPNPACGREYSKEELLG